MESTRPGGQIGVAIVDDDADFAESLAALLELDPRLDVVGIANSVATGVELVCQPDVGIALVDVNMSDGGGVGLVRRSRAVDGGLTILLVSAQRRPDDLGAAGVQFAAKHALTADLIHQVATSHGHA